MYVKRSVGRCAITVRKKDSVHTTNAAKHRTQVISMLYCTLAPKVAPDAVVPLGLVVLCEPEEVPFDPLEFEEDDDGGAAVARLLTEAHVAAMFVLVLPSR
jgi:hypothetical protein